jgi:hypothetical protein
MIKTISLCVFVEHVYIVIRDIKVNNRFSENKDNL